MKVLFLLICALIGINGSQDCCKFLVKRRDWAALPPKEIFYQVKPVNYVIINHTATETCSTKRECSKLVGNIQGYHMNSLDYNDIGYNFLVGNDGNIYEGVGWHKVGSHAIGYNSRSIGIAFIGNFDDELPTALALNNAKKFLEYGEQIGELASNYSLLGAKQVMSTISPGFELYKELQDWPHFSVKA